MKRNYLSGAQKRKAAKDRKKRDESILKKIPRIENIIGSAGASTANAPSSSSTSTSTSSERDQEQHNAIIDTESGETEENRSLSDSQSEYQNIGDQNQYEVDASGSDSAFSDSLLPFPADAALWNMESDSLRLQSFWAKDGSCLDSHFNSNRCVSSVFGLCYNVCFVLLLSSFFRTRKMSEF